jgi:hypothetical protein
LDRRTDRPDGSGGGSPTVVTSRAAGDDLIGDEQDAQPDGIVVPPRPSRQKPTPAKPAPAGAVPPDDAVSDGTRAGPATNGGSAAIAKEPARPAADATPADGVPALPSDTIRTSRGSRSTGADPDRKTPPSKAAEQSSVDDSPAFSFGAPPSGPATAAADPAEFASDPAEFAPDPAEFASDPAEFAAKPSGDDAWPTAPSNTAPSGRPPGVSAAPAELPSVSPAAFAWEMPDPPPNSPSSPARTFLRSGTTEQGSAAPKAASSANPGKTGAAQAAVGMAAVSEGPVTMRKASQKGQSKRSARQAHLTIARVEPWSVMKFSFVVSLVAFVILFVAVTVLYGVLSGLGVFDSLQRVVASITSSQGSAGVNAKAWFSASKVLGYTALLGSFNIVLITAMATIGSVVYNLTSRLVGGVEVTLRETE